MDIEYEAKFLNIGKEDIRRRLARAGAKLVRPEYLQRRIPFDLPGSKRSKHAWLRVRDEGNKITMSLKMVDGDKIEDQKEIQLEVNSFDDTVRLLAAIGCQQKSYQETKRELWMLDGVEVAIDEWPFLEPFVEIEGPSEAAVKNTSGKIGFDYGKAVFGAVGKLYKMKYDIYPDEVNHLPKIVFDMKNPFIRP